MEFRIWLLSLCNHFEIHAHCSTDPQFLFISELFAIACIYHNLSIHLLMGLLGSFQFAAITNKAAGNGHVQVFVWTCAFFSLR